jgi:flagellar protein FliL
MPAEREVQNEGDGSKPGSKLFFFLTLGLCLALLGGGGYFGYTQFLASQPEEQIRSGRGIGEMYGLEPFVVNLSDPKGKRYLKIQLEIELMSPEAVERAARATPKLRDMVIMMITSLTFEDVMTPEGKILIRDELLQRFNQIMRPDRVLNIYFTEFVIQ